jgi:ATP-dependent exoDNAse (exonuclease V) beta subunit
MSQSNFTVYRASAGSGKTYTIVSKYIDELLKNPQFAYRYILAVTFANDAAGEMKERILEKLREIANDDKNENSKKAKTAYRAILQDYGNFNVGTIDSFFQKILRNLAKELGINSQFDIETDSNLSVKEAVKTLIDKSATDDKILSKIMSFLEHKLENEKWDIQRDLENFAQNIFKETFQKREKDLRKQIINEPQKIINSINECKKIKRNFEDKIKSLAKDFDETDEKKLKEAEKEFRLQNIEKYNSACLLLKHIYPLQLLESISLEIDLQNKEQNKFMLAKTNQLLSEMIGEEDTSFIYEKIGAKIKSVIIDEFQDTSTLQWKNFSIMIKEILAENNFGMLVGDVKQSIYRWRNSDWKILNDMENYENLEYNWRSAKNIIEFNNDLFDNISKDFAADIQKAYKDVRQKTPEKKEIIDGFVSVDFVRAERDGRKTTLKFSDAVIEKLAEKISFLLENGVLESDICILCRSGKQIREIAEKLPKLLKTKVKIISEQAYKLESSKEVRMIISALQIINEPNNPIHKVKLLLKREKILPEDLAKLSNEDINNLSKDISEISKLSFYDLIIKLCDLFEFNKTMKNSAFLFAFIDKVLDFARKNTNSIPKFLEYWDEKLKEENLPMPTGKNDKRDGILLMTIHKSKGLEFHSVIVPFLDWAMSEHSTLFKQNLLCCPGKSKPFDLAIVPVEHSKEASESLFKNEYEDEKLAQNMDNLNVLYVALTRAGKNLILIAKEPSKDSSKKDFKYKKEGCKYVQDLIHKFLKEDTVGKIEPHKAEKSETDKKTHYISFNMSEKKMFVRGVK